MLFSLEGVILPFSLTPRHVLWQFLLTGNTSCAPCSLWHMKTSPPHLKENFASISHFSCVQKWHPCLEAHSVSNFQWVTSYSIPPVIPSDCSTLAGIKWGREAIWHNQQSHPMPTLTHPFSKMSFDKNTEANGGQTMQVRKYPFCTFVRGLLKENVPLWDNSCV